MGWTI